MTEVLVKLFLPIIIGYTLVQLKYVNSSISRDLKNFVVKVTVPATILISMSESDMDTLKQLIPVSLSYVLLSFILILLSFLTLIKVKDSRLKAAYMLTITWGNYGWMGWAVLNSAYGTEGFSRGVFFTSLWWPVLFSGAFIITKLTKISSALDAKSYIINMTIPTVMLILGVTINLTGITIYEPLRYTLKELGDMTVTLILFSVGLTISLKDGYNDLKRAMVPVVLRPILGIIGGFLTVWIIGVTDPISRSSVLIESAMPVAVLAVVMGDMLGLDEKLLSSILILSTILSIITIPLSLVLLG